MPWARIKIHQISTKASTKIRHTEKETLNPSGKWTTHKLKRISASVAYFGNSLSF